MRPFSDLRGNVGALELEPSQTERAVRFWACSMVKGQLRLEMKCVHLNLSITAHVGRQLK